MEIYKTLLQENLVADDQYNTKLSELINKHFPDGIGHTIPANAQGLFDEIASMDGWTEPADINEKTAVEPYKPIYFISLKDGRWAGMVLFSLFNGKTSIPMVNIIELEQSNTKRPDEIKGIPFAFSVEDDHDGGLAFREPYDENYKKHVLDLLRPFLEQVKDMYHILRVTVTADRAELSYVTHEEEAHQPVEGEKLQPFVREYFETHLCGNFETGYSTDYGWSSDIRECRRGYIGDNFSPHEGKVSNEQELHNAFYQWAQRNGAVGDSLSEGNIFISFIGFHWENINDFT